MEGKDSGENKGFAFVTFRSAELAPKAIDELNNTEFKAEEFGTQKSVENIETEAYIAVAGEPSKKKSKGNMGKGVFKGSMWTSITTELNRRTGKDFIPNQVQQKHNRLRTKQRKWSQLLRHTGLG
nr:hypothetical protein CFP56_49236 [Quercus suber]